MKIFDEIEELRQNLLSEKDEWYLDALSDIETRIKNKVKIQING